MVSYQSPHFFNGRYRALVIDDKDPLFRMRVKVRIPDLMLTQEKNHEFVGKWNEKGVWAFPANNYLGGRNVQDTKIRMEAPEAYYQGSCLIPPRGSHVWVIFEKGDVSHPFYTGSAEYGDCVAPPENQIGKEYQKKWTLLKTAEGRCIIASDDPSDCRFEITGKKRMIKDPPFGDINSVYTIDGNQTVFLIDEREDHEKILIKDYIGDFIKLVQNENGEAGKFHMHTNSDMILDCGGDFYLNVTGDIKVRAQNVYVTAVENIYHKAYMQLKEYAKAFDRTSTVYDKTTSGRIDIASMQSINLQATTKIYETSIVNVRNALTISDVAAANYTLAAGGYVSLAAGGTVAVYGKTGVAIQASPLFNSLSNTVSYAGYALDPQMLSPDGERYQDIEYDKEPILKLDTDKDSLTGFELKHDPVPTEQSSCAGVGTMSNTSTLSKLKKTSSNTTSSSSSSSSSNKGSGSSSSSSSSGSSSSDKNVEEDKTSKLSDITNQIKDIAKELIFSATNAGIQMTTEISVFSDSVKNYAYAKIVGANSKTSPYVDKNGDLNYNYDSFSSIGENSKIDATSWFDEFMDKSYEEVSNSLVYDVSYDSLNASDCVKDIYKSCEAIQSYLTDQFLNDSKNSLINSSYTNDLSYYTTSITNSSYDCLDTVTNQRKKNSTISQSSKQDISNVLKSYIDNYIYSAVSKATDDCMLDNYSDLQNKCEDMLQMCNEIVSDNKYTISYDFAMVIQDNIRNSTKELKRRLLDATKIQMKNDSLLTNESMTLIIESAKDKAKELAQKFSNIDTYRENTKLINEAIENFVTECSALIQNNKLTDSQCEDYLKQISSQYDEKIESAIKKLENFEVPTDIFTTTLEKIIGKFENNVFDIIKVYNNFKTALSIKYSDRLSIKLEDILVPMINDINQYSNDHSEDSPEVIKELKKKIVNLYEETKKQICVKGIFKTLLTESEIDEFISTLKKNFNDTFITINNDTITTEINSLLKDDVLSIEKRRQMTLSSSITIEDELNNKFSKYNTISYETIPDYIGFGYKYLLFLNDKYRKTIVPLIVKSGGNVLSFDIVLNTSEISEKYQLINQDAITVYNTMFSNLSNIDTTTVWWENLKSVMEQCSIFNIRVVINLVDFNDNTNPFILNKSEKIIYTDKNWNDKLQGAFFSKLFEVISKYECEVIYNLGRGSYKNSYDPNNEYYVIYPNCGYLRKMINYFVYESGITSNNLSLTANENDNLYYYSPYTEYHSYDDQNEHELGEHDILIYDYIDSKDNDNANIVTYDTNNKVGGYAGYIIKCHKDSIPIFNMNSLSSHITDELDIGDVNVMNHIFCKNSREAVRYFKTKDYFETTSELEFDVTGEVK